MSVSDTIWAWLIETEVELVDETQWMDWDLLQWDWPVIPQRRIILMARTAQEISESYNP